MSEYVKVLKSEICDRVLKLEIKPEFQVGDTVFSMCFLNPEKITDVDILIKVPLHCLKSTAARYENISAPGSQLLATMIHHNAVGAARKWLSEADDQRFFERVEMIRSKIHDDTLMDDISENIQFRKDKARINRIERAKKMIADGLDLLNRGDI